MNILKIKRESVRMSVKERKTGIKGAILQTSPRGRSTGSRIRKEWRKRRTQKNPCKANVVERRRENIEKDTTVSEEGLARKSERTKVAFYGRVLTRAAQGGQRNKEIGEGRTEKSRSVEKDEVMGTSKTVLGGQRISHISKTRWEVSIGLISWKGLDSPKSCRYDT